MNKSHIAKVLMSSVFSLERGMSEEERRIVRAGIVRRGIEPPERFAREIEDGPMSYHSALDATERYLEKYRKVFEMEVNRK